MSISVGLGKGVDPVQVEPTLSLLTEDDGGCRGDVGRHTGRTGRGHRAPDLGGRLTSSRVDEVVAHVVDERGELAAVATVAQKILPRLGQPMYYYRCFVGQAWRSS